MRRSLVIWWDVEDNEIELDTEELSVFDVVGLLQVALDIAEQYVPSPYDSEEAE